MGLITIGRMMAVDDFIGSTFPTPAGGVLTVVGWDGRRQGSGKLYTVTCSACSLDSELFKDGLCATKSDLLRGRVCCGCSGHYKWSLRQYELRLRRSMAESQYSFVRWVDESAKVSNSNKFVYHCETHGEQTCAINPWLCGARCRLCADKKARKTTPEFIAEADSVHNGRYDYSLTEYTEARSPLTITCREHGAFVQLPFSHLNGKGCRACSDAEVTKSQAEFIEHALRVHGDTYDYSQVVYCGSFEPVEIICTEHGAFRQTPAGHLGGHGCPSCAKGGFDTGKPASVYILRIEGMQGEFTGYGITGNVDQRLRRHTNKLRQSGFGIVESIVFDFDDGQTALDIENMLKAEFPMTPQEVEGFLTEATFADQFANVVNFVQQQETALS